MTKDCVISYRQLGKLVRKLSIKPNTLLLVKRDGPFDDDQAIDSLIRIIEKTQTPNVVVAIVDDPSDLTMVDQAEMRKHGWIRFNDLKRVLAIPSLKEKDDDKDGS